MKTLITSLKFTLTFCVLLFAGYVLILWGFAAVINPNHGEAELLTLNGRIVGAANVGQPFTQMNYFWGRPSAVGYNAAGSGGSNKGPSNEAYLGEVQTRIALFIDAHPYLNKKELPSELVTASGSGLDPHISPRAAEVQIRRVAEARAVPEEVIKKIVAEQTHRPLPGQPYINVLELNIALDNEVRK